MMLKRSDPELQMGYYRLRTDRPSLGFPTCRSLRFQRRTQLINVVGDRIGGIRRNTDGITIGRRRAPEIRCASRGSHMVSQPLPVSKFVADVSSRCLRAYSRAVRLRWQSCHPLVMAR